VGNYSLFACVELLEEDMVGLKDKIKIRKLEECKCY